MPGYKYVWYSKLKYMRLACIASYASTKLAKLVWKCMWKYGWFTQEWCEKKSGKKILQFIIYCTKS